LYADMLDCCLKKSKKMKKEVYWPQGSTFSEWRTKKKYTKAELFKYSKLFNEENEENEENPQKRKRNSIKSKNLKPLSNLN
jgi:hypothetical protein